MADLPALPSAELQKQSTVAVASYAHDVVTEFSPAEAQVIIRENLRAFALTYGEIYGHDGAAEFMEMLASRQRQFAADDRHTAAIVKARRREHPPSRENVFNIRDFERKAAP